MYLPHTPDRQIDPPQIDVVLEYKCLFCDYSSELESEFAWNIHKECACIDCKIEITQEEKDSNMELTFKD